MRHFTVIFLIGSEPSNEIVNRINEVVVIKIKIDKKKESFFLINILQRDVKFKSLHIYILVSTRKIGERLKVYTVSPSNRIRTPDHSTRSQGVTTDIPHQIEM